MTTQFDHWIDGRKVRPEGGEHFPTFDPTRAVPWAELAKGNVADIDRAVESATRAQRAWRRTSPAQRNRLLSAMADLIDREAGRLAELESRDVGKVLRETRSQMRALPTWYRYYASLAFQQDGRVIPHDRASIVNLTTREPYGVIGIIAPFNSPVLLTSMSLAPAIAAGNAVVVKPAETASTSVIRLAELFAEAGLPDGVFNVVTGLGAEAGAALVAHPGIAKVFFTGGVETGRRVAAEAGLHGKPTVLELGGKSANIVLPDAADLRSVANGIVAGIYAAAGQTCVAGSRLLVHSSIADELVDLVAARTEKIILGDPADDRTEMGPLAEPNIVDNVERRVDEAITAGARVRVGGSRLDAPGWFYRPTILTDVVNDMAVAREELFGPVLAVIRFHDDDEAVAIANDSPFGLAAGLWTTNIGRAHRMAAALEAGTVWVNTYRALSYASPFGGRKASGYGRENGLDGFAEVTVTKSLWIETSEESIDDPFILR
jgi:aldehyde dehydrogenase (NAD+)